MAKQRRSGQDSVFQRSDGVWVAQVYLDRDPSTGRRRRKTRSASTQKEAYELLAGLRRELAVGATKVDRRLRFEQWLERWLADEVTYRRTTGSLRASTAASYGRLARCHLIPQLGYLKLTDVTPSALQAGYSRMLDAGLNPSSVNKVHSVARSALQAAYREGYITSNPADRATPPVAPRKEAEHLELGQVDLLLATAPEWDRALWTIMADAGLRVGEALGLAWEDLDLDERTVRVRRTLLKASPTAPEFGPPKSVSGSRTVPLTDRAAGALREHRRLMVARRLAATSWVETDAVFPSQRGTWQSVRNVQRRFAQLRERAGLPTVARPHTLRHTYVARLLVAGVPPFVVSRIAGHADLSTTTRIYGHLIEDASDINEDIRRALHSAQVRRLADVSGTAVEARDSRDDSPPSANVP